MDVQRVEQLLHEAVKENELFLVDYSIDANGVIKVLVDSMEGIKVHQCMAVSRHIEHNLDREEWDFSLEVSSPGATAEFTVPQQYVKNIGRTVKLKLKDGSEMKGKMISVEENIVTLEWKEREPKPIGKGKVTVNKSKAIAMDEIVQAKVVISF